jgi:cell division protein FtsN
MTVQRGGFAMGLIVGLLVGLALALGVALYVTKVPVPFLNKVPQRTAEQDAAEAERNKNWDPNAPLAGKAVRPAASAVAPAPPPPAPAAVVTAPAKPAAPTASAPKSTRDPAAILAGQAPAPPTATRTPSTKPGADPFTYFVQVGAYARQDDAEQQRARVALMGMTAKVTEREQSGRTMYRVRIGPFDRKEQADAAQDKLAGNGVEAALVRVER